MIGALLSLLLIVLAVLPVQAQWTNEPPGSAVIYDCPMTDSICGMQDGYNSASYASPGYGGQSVSPPRAMDSFLGPNATTGGGQWTVPFSQTREIYFAMSWATNPQFQGLDVLTNKLIFLHSGPGDNSFLVWQGGQDSVKTLKWYQQSVVDNCHLGTNFQPGGSFPNFCWNGAFRDGTGWFEPNVSGAGAIGAGTGYRKIEIYLRASTSQASRDGIIRIWVDGTKTTDYTTVNFANPYFDYMAITPTWDGSGALTCSRRDCSRRWDHYFDHIRISSPSCGPGGCGGGTSPAPPPPPPLAPNKPTNLRVQ